MDFGSRLQKLRLEKGWTQSELAKRSGLSKSAVSMYENNQRQPDDDVMRIFAKLFGVHVGYLRGYNDITGVEHALRDYISENNISIYELSERVGIPIEEACELIDDENSEREWNFTDVLDLASALNIGVSKLLKWNTGLLTREQYTTMADFDRMHINAFYEGKVPLLGRVPAGPENWVSDDIEDWINFEPKEPGEYVALRISGSSMEPTMMDGDIVFVRLQQEVRSGDLAVVRVNGDEDTCKEVQVMDDGLLLIAHNPSVYKPRFYSAEQIERLPVQIKGKVVALKRDL